MAQNDKNKKDVKNIDFINNQMGIGSFSFDVNAKTTEEDKEWARRFFHSGNSFFGGQSRSFLKAIRNGQRWRADFAIQLNGKLNVEDRFISVSIGKKALLEAIKHKHVNIVKDLVSHDFLTLYASYQGVQKKILETLSEKEHRYMLKIFVENNYIDINACNQEILYQAVTVEDRDMCVFILDLGADYDIVRRRIEKRDHTSELNVLSYTIGLHNSKIKEQKQLTKRIENEKETTTTTTTTTNEWDAMDDDKIVQHEKIPNTSISLETIFNFKARNVTTICHESKDVTATVIIQNFKDIESDKILFEAWHKLKDLGKKPTPFNGNDNFTVHKPSTNKKIKIEGR